MYCQNCGNELSTTHSHSCCKRPRRRSTYWETHWPHFALLGGSTLLGIVATVVGLMAR